jgi:hypothetical protein
MHPSPVCETRHCRGTSSPLRSGPGDSARLPRFSAV